MARRTENIEIALYIDEDDSSYDSAINTKAGSLRFGHSTVDHSATTWGHIQTIHRGPRMTLSDTWNVLAKHALGDILMMCADDVLFRTEPWDAFVEAAFDEVPDRILFVHGDDGCHSGKTFGTLGFIHRKWYDAVGYFVPPGFAGDYSDTWLNEVANMIGRKKYVPIVTEHLHPIWGKAPMDDTYRERKAKEVAQDAARLYASKLAERQRDAAKLRAVMVS